MVKNKLFSIQSLTTSVKAIVISIITSLITLFGYWLSTKLGSTGMIISVLILIFNLFFWGYLANISWGWNKK